MTRQKMAVVAIFVWLLANTVQMTDNIKLTSYELCMGSYARPKGSYELDIAAMSSQKAAMSCA